MNTLNEIKELYIAMWDECIGARRVEIDTFTYVAFAWTWKIVVALLALSMLCTLWKKWKKGVLPEPIVWEPEKGIMTWQIMLTALTAFAMAITAVVNEKQRTARAVSILCCCGSYLYVILNNKLASGLTWKEYIMKAIDKLMLFILELRGLIQRAYQWKERKRTRKSFFGALIVVIILSCYIAILRFPDYASTFYLVFIISMLIYSILYGLQSCSSFFRVWVFSIVAAIFVAGAAGLGEHIAWTGAIIFAALVCMFTGALANYDTAKLATNIVNTLTTLVVMVVNVLAAWRFTRGELSDSGLATVQYEVNSAVLPYAVAGYLTALFKDIQVYWEEHRMREIPPGSEVVKIRDWIYIPDEKKM